MALREFEALKAIWRKGGKAPINAMGRAMRISSEYAKVILLDIGEKDYIDVARNGMCKITEKGKELLRSRGILDRIAREQKDREEAEQKRIKEKVEEGNSKIISINY